MTDEIFKIEITPNSYGSEWRHIWDTNNFSEWEDACSWLTSRYRARAVMHGDGGTDRVGDFRLRWGGFVLVFIDQESQSQFALEWL